MNSTPTAQALLQASARLAESLEKLTWPDVVVRTYNPLRYAWEPFKQYIERFAAGPREIMFLGMNPGPWGMAQTGIPFGEVAAVRDWLEIQAIVHQPEVIHPARPIEGFSCKRSEVSGRRLWGLFAEQFATPQEFFKRHFVSNYCPLSFMNESGANLTPDKFPIHYRKPLEALCDQYLVEVANLLQVRWIIGVGGFARSCAERIQPNVETKPSIGTLLHPSPASPISNREWPTRPLMQMRELGLW